MAAVDIKSALIGALVFAMPTLIFVFVNKSKAAKLIVNKANHPRATTLQLDELTETKYLCRCWQSKNYPYCDGAHKAYNEATGDTLGPLILKK